MLRQEHIFKRCTFVFPIPFDLGFPVKERWVIHLACFLVFFDEVILRIDITQFTTGNGIPHPVYKLSIFIVGDFSFIHIECTHRNGAGIINVCIRDILITHSHSEASHRDISHPKGIGLIEFLTLFYTYQFSVA